MPIYNISKLKESESTTSSTLSPADLLQTETPLSRKDRFFSSLTTRLLFSLLFIGDLLWMVYAGIKIAILAPLMLLTFCKVPLIRRHFKKNWLALKRAAICGLSLLVALFSPALGIMVACTYFLMYDKAGIQEVVPRSLQDQFQEFLKDK